VEAWRVAWELDHLEAHRSLPSTNDRARRLAAEGVGPVAAVLAEEQTRGRGRRGRSWHSPPGQGLWISFVLPAPEASGYPLAPLLVGIAAARAIDGTTGATTGIQWPNDVLLAERKVGGVLCEAVSNERVVAGVGINVAQSEDDFPAEIRGRAGSLRTVTGMAVDRPGLAGALVRELRDLFGGEAPPNALTGRLGDELRDRDRLLGRRVSCTVGVAGVGRGIGADGALLVEEEATGRLHRITAGSVRPAGEGPWREERGERRDSRTRGDGCSGGGGP